MATVSSLCFVILTCVIAALYGQDCGTVPEVAHSTNNATDVNTFPEDTVIVYHCSLGYYLDGSREYRCRGGEWEGPGTRCNIRCPFLKSRSHQSHEGDDLSVGSIVTFSCDEGYELRGARNLICRTDGDWNTAQPTCQIVRCPKLSASSNVRMSRHTSSGNMEDFGAFGSVAEFSCSPGFNGSGSSRRVCQADGEWTGQTFTCTEVDCGFPGNIGNGSIGDLQGTTVGSTAILMCHEDAVASSESIICREDGQWSQGRCIACPTGSDLHSFLYNNKCYVFVDDSSWFSGAKDYCSAKGWDLVSILNRELNNFLTERKTHLNWSDDVWIGAEWRNGQWEWPREAMMWSNWGSGEGGTTSGWKLEKCAVLASNGKWKDKVWWPGSRKFICEANITQ